MTGTRCGCGREHVADAPHSAQQPGTVSYGLSFQAWAVFLMVMHHVPAGRCADILESMSGTRPSDGWGHALLSRAAAAVAAADKAIRGLILLAPVICGEETPIQCNGSACLNITKQCEARNNHCGLYWTEELKGINWKSAQGGPSFSDPGQRSALHATGRLCLHQHLRHRMVRGTRQYHARVEVQARTLHQPPISLCKRMTVANLTFPTDGIVGELWWQAGSAWEPVFATGVVTVPDGADVSLEVARIESVQRSAAGLEVGYGNEPLDLGFLRELPVDVITGLKVNYWIVPGCFPAVTHLAPGLRQLSLAATDLDDGALTIVAQLSRLNSLQVYGNRFTDEGMQQLAALQDLEELYVEERTLSAAAFTFATRLPRLAQLAGLDEVPMPATDIERVKGMLLGVNGAFEMDRDAVTIK